MANNDFSNVPAETPLKELEPKKKVNKGKKPVVKQKTKQQHECTFAMHSNDVKRQVQTYYYLNRLNQEFLECAVYDSSSNNSRLIGVEYMISARVYQLLPPEEQKLWHFHACEVVKEDLWSDPYIMKLLQMSGVSNFSTTYGKFWNTWRVDTGDAIPLGAPSLKLSSQSKNLELVKSEQNLGNSEKQNMSIDVKMEDTYINMEGEDSRLLRKN